MKITIEPTGKFESVSGIRCRMWKGITEKGVAVELYVPAIRALTEADQTEFERDLVEVKAERHLVSFDTRML